MKSRFNRLLLVAVASLVIFPFWAQSQKKSIVLEDIFKNRKFSSKGVSGYTFNEGRDSFHPGEKRQFKCL